MKSAIKGFYLFLTAVLIPNIALSFCGFYVGKSDTNLFNESSKVVMVHKDNKNVITMVNDYQGDVGEFAMVVPVPEVLLEGQIHITQNKIIDHLDGYSAPRLVEYFDNDPCQIMRYKNAAVASPTMLMEDGIGAASSKVLGVTVEAQYSVGEYDIIILSAKESNGLETWLKQNKYKIPEGASQVLESYIRQGMKFFVAKVNLKKFDKSGNVFLSPLQIAFESNKFMLPIRLGTVNSKGKQDLFIYALSSKGRVESSNYRTVQIPSNITLPIYIKKDFGNTYKAIYNTAAKKENYSAVFTEYAWDMNWCDPCAAEPLSREELKELGVFWLDETPINIAGSPKILGPVNVFVTRLHVTYDAKNFPEDLMFNETSDRQNFQGRYILQNPWKGDAKCPEAQAYFDSLNDRFEQEARSLANLTDWDINAIRKEMESSGQKFDIKPKKLWWEKLWGNEPKNRRQNGFLMDYNITHTSCFCIYLVCIVGYKRNSAQEALSGIDVQLKKRSDLIPNILKIAKKFLEHERGIMEEITKLRAKVDQDYNKNDANAVKEHLVMAENLASKIGGLMVQVENYPNLKSDQTMLNAMESYNEVEAQIAAARRFYNSAVKNLNNMVQIFPGNIIAGMVSIEAMPFYEAEDASKTSVDAGNFL